MQENLDRGRIHILVGAHCNNNCVFCMEEDREARRAIISSQTPQAIKNLILASRGAEEVLFTSGEPTLNPHLVTYVRLAAAVGFPTVGVISNGRRFADLRYLATLLDAGLNAVTVSIHGPDARVHDALTRTPLAFAQTAQGLANIAFMRRSRSFRFHTSTVLNRRNLPLFDAMLRFLAEFEADAHIFNVMMPEGRGERLFDALMPRYREVATEVAASIKSLPPALVERVALVDIPPCCTEGLLPQVRGHVEQHTHFEPDGRFQELLAARAGVAAPRGQKVDNFEQVSSSSRDAMGRVKGPACALCRYDPSCPGVYRTYVERVGFEEFRPVR